MIPVDCDKSCMYIVIHRATTKKTIQTDILKNIIINKSKWNPKNVHVTNNKAIKEKWRNEKQREQTKIK